MELDPTYATKQAATVSKWQRIRNVQPFPQLTPLVTVLTIPNGNILRADFGLSKPRNAGQLYNVNLNVLRRLNGLTLALADFKCAVLLIRCRFDSILSNLLARRVQTQSLF